MPALQLLLMRHGAGTKLGQDTEKVPPGPDGVLTADGYRDAQAVGQRLAETLAWSSSPARGVVCCYASQPEGAQTATAPSRSDTLRRRATGARGEPEATARVVAAQLAATRIPTGTLQPYDPIRPDKLQASSPDPVAIKEAAHGLEAKAGNADGQLVLVVGNAPQIEWTAEHVLKQPVAIARGEVIAISEPCRRWSRLWRSRRELLWTVGPGEESAIKDLRDKIRSKMDTAKFLGTFITALVTFVLGKRFDAIKDGGVLQGGPGDVQGVLWLATVAALGMAALLCFAAVCYYDGLLMPVRFWASSARPPWWRFWRRAERDHRLRVRWLVERPPSSAAWVPQQNMVRVWTRPVVTAMWALGAALAAFAVLLVAKPRNYGDLGWPIVLTVVLGAVAFGYVAVHRPRLGAQD